MSLFMCVYFLCSSCKDCMLQAQRTCITTEALGHAVVSYQTTVVCDSAASSGGPQIPLEAASSLATPFLFILLHHLTVAQCSVPLA